MLRDLAETPAPPSGVDIARAAAAGRRLRVRRLVSGGSAAVGVTAVVAAIGLLAPGLPPASPPAAMPSQAPMQFDPLAQYAAFGWLPDGYTSTTLTNRRDLLLLSAEYPALPIDDWSTPVTLRLQVAAAGTGGVQPFLVLPENPAAYEATEINGRAAWWTENQDYTYLGWEYAPQSWAYVDVWIHVPGVETREFVRGLARRVAENVRYGADEPVRLPFATTGVPAWWPISGVEVRRGDEEWSAWATYDDPDTGDRSALTIGVDAGIRDWWSGPEAGEPNTSIDGHPALLVTDVGGGSSLLVYPVDGLFVQVSTTSAVPGGLEAVFRATEFYPDPADWR
jgi:hypothetical protein